MSDIWRQRLQKAIAAIPYVKDAKLIGENIALTFYYTGEESRKDQAKLERLLKEIEELVPKNAYANIRINSKREGSIHNYTLEPEFPKTMNYPQVKLMMERVYTKITSIIEEYLYKNEHKKIDFSKKDEHKNGHKR